MAAGQTDRQTVATDSVCQSDAKVQSFISKCVSLSFGCTYICKVAVLYSFQGHL